MHLYTLPQYESALKDFSNFYEIQNILKFPKDKPPTTLKKKSERVCRFCGLDSTKTTFKKAAHIAPQCLGNKFGISDFECDACNARFSVYESHLAYFLGIQQSFSGSLSRKGIPTLKSSKKDLEVRQMNIRGVDGLLIKKTGTDSKAIAWTENDVITITFSKGSYKPNYVYKALLKIALCALPATDVSKYAPAFNYLLEDNTFSTSGMASVGIFEFNSSFSDIIPFGYLFKKRDSKIILPTHQFAFYFYNKIILLCLPYNLDDMQTSIYGGAAVSIPTAPPLMSFPYNQDIPNRFWVESLASSALKKGEEQTLYFQVNAKDLENLVRLDHVKGEYVTGHFDKEQQLGIFIVPNGAVISPGTYDPIV